MLTHLHTRSYFSLLQSPTAIEQIVLKAKEYGYQSVSLTDFKTMHGTMAFLKSCKKHNIKPIVGLEIELLYDEIKAKALIISKTNQGMHQLFKLSTYIELNQVVEISKLQDYMEDNILIMYGEGGHFEEYFKDHDKLQLKLEEFKNDYQDFYMAISYNDGSYFKQMNDVLKSVCDRLEIETIALSKIYYINKEDNYLYKILKGVKNNLTINDKTLVVENNRYFRTKEEMQSLYDSKDLENTNKIAEMIDISLDSNITSLPKFKVKGDISSKDYLIHLCQAGLKKRLNNKVTDIYVKRLKYELNVILQMNFEDYFLIVYDIVRYAKTVNIYVGPGRGSAAGSLVSYCLGITHVDPIKYDLLFERFLNPERISMPDIDMDLPDNRRNEIIDYVKDTYGKDHFANIITFNTMKARQVVKDVSKVLGIPLSKAEQVSKTIPSVLNMTLTKAYNEYLPFKQLINSDKALIEMFKVALKLEGIPRHTSIHAAGVVISDKNINEVLPLIDTINNSYVTQYTMEHLEQLGLIKMDLLGLRNLTIIDEITNNINKIHEFDIYKIPLNDKRTFEIVNSAKTLGVFQLESDGMKSLLKRLKPEKFEDIVACIALFRPGPMQNIPTFIENRYNPSKVEYLHQDLIPILKETYGIIVYQEQIMMIAQRMASFSLAKADILRKAMSKKNKEELESLSQEFIDGAIKNGYSLGLAKKLYELIMRFADYGFNKSHSVAYGLIAYQLAYFKANYPIYFYQSLLNSVINSELKTSEYIHESKKVINIIGVNVNISNSHYTVCEQGLIMPLTLIKTVTLNVTKIILEERNKSQFNDYYDFIVRVTAHKVSIKVLEMMISAGALDCFNLSRLTMIKSLKKVIDYADIIRIEKEDGPIFNYSLVSKPALIHAKDDKMRKGQKEKEALGFYYSVHPINELKKQHNIIDVPLIKIANSFKYIKGVGMIERVKQHKTKTGELMAFINISDDTSNIDLVVMPYLYKQHIEELVVNSFVIFEGNNDKENSCLVKKIEIIKTQGENIDG